VTGQPEAPIPTITGVSRPYWDGLGAKELRVQHCSTCDHSWLPAREECPRCLAAEPVWQTVPPTARAVSWVTYHRAMHPYFADKVPYTVVLAELDCGARLISTTETPEKLSIDALLDVRFTQVADVWITQVEPA